MRNIKSRKNSSNGSWVSLSLGELLKSFLKKKGISEHDVPDHTLVSNIISTDAYANNDRKVNAPASLWDLAMVFESFLNLETSIKKKHGAYYTPKFIVDYLVSTCFDLFQERNLDRIPYFLDPSCGSGLFLIKALEEYQRRFALPFREALNYIVGIDINNKAVKFARLIVELAFILNQEEPPDDFSFILKRADFLEYDPAYKLKFDIIATNPPYVKLQNLPDKYRKLRERFHILKGNYTLANLFLLKGYEHLSHDGILGYIFPNNLFTSISAKKLRRYIIDNKAIRRVVDFKHCKIFDGVRTYTALIFLTRYANNEIEYLLSLNPVQDLSTNRNNCHRIRIDRFLKSDRWIFAPTERDFDYVSKIETNGVPLGELTDIKVGFATLKDSVFILSEDEVERNHIERDIIKPAIKIAEVESETDLHNSVKFVIFPYRKVSGVYVPLSPVEFRELYPNAYEYLLQYKQVLEERSAFQKGQIRYFYEWGRTQGMESIPIKLLTKTFNKKSDFMLDTTGALFCNGYAVVPKHYYNIDIRILQKVLNSVVMNYYIKLTSYTIEGNYSCFQKNFIERFCIPLIILADRKVQRDIEDTDGEELDMLMARIYGVDYNHILSLVRRFEASNC